MRECRFEDDALLITALVKYHDDLRERDPERARQAWTRARDLAAEHGLTIDDAVSYRFWVRRSVHFQLERALP